MRRRLAIAICALMVFGLGWYGSWSYGHDYYLYRGFGKTSEPKGIVHGHLLTFHFWSPSLHKHRAALVYLPPGYFSGAQLGRRYPVLYLLQASVAQMNNYIAAGALNVRVDTLLHQHRIPPFITVMPEGHGRDHEWADAQAGNFEGYVLDLVHAIDKRFSTIDNRRGRAIGGLSEGGYGAANIALRHLDTFSQFESWSGYFIQPGGFPFVGPSLSKIDANSPLLYLPRLRPQLRKLPLRAFIYQGNREGYPVSQFYKFADVLRAEGAQVQTAIYPGKHNWKLWRIHLPHMLVWVGQGFRR